MLAAQNDRENALSPVTSGQLHQLANGLREHSGFVEVLSSLQQGHGGTIGGTWGAASSLAVAGIASARAEERQGLVVVVVPHAVDADMFADDLTLFTSLAIDVLPPIESLSDPSTGHETQVNDPAEAAVLKSKVSPNACFRLRKVVCKRSETKRWRSQVPGFKTEALRLW